MGRSGDVLMARDEPPPWYYYYYYALSGRMLQSLHCFLSLKTVAVRQVVPRPSLFLSASVESVSRFGVGLAH